MAWQLFNLYKPYLLFFVGFARDLQQQEKKRAKKDDILSATLYPTRPPLEKIKGERKREKPKNDV